MKPNVTILVPAAGASSRMQGRDKLMEMIGGQTALHRAVRISGATGAQVVVTLPESGPYAAARRATLTGLRCQILSIRDYQDGMAASIRAGAQAAGMSEGLMVHLPDMPDLETSDLARLIEAFARDPSHPVRATSETEVPGHPVILPRRLFSTLAVLTGDRGARAAVEGLPVQLIALEGDRALVDLDTPQEWEQWRAGRADPRQS